MAMIDFETTLFMIGDWTILRLPEAASAKLPSRGQVMVKGTINDVAFELPLEPDGNFSHWLKIDDVLGEAIHASAGDIVHASLESTKDWPEPVIPPDFKKALSASAKAQEVWQKATPMAHWEWVRWMRATGRAETRERRVKVGISKLEHGERRPCCWNRNLCTEPSVSKNGVLLQPAAIFTQ